MKVEKLKSLDKIYGVQHRHIVWYTYVCVHPKNKKYHILLDKSENPVRMYEVQLETLLSKNIKSYEEAKRELINRLEEYIQSIKGERS